jgi:hypothetical protein
MPTTLTALFAAAIYEARSAEADPTGVQRAATMLVTAAGARRLTFAVDAHQIFINDVPLDTAAPGADLVRLALERHATARLMLPAGLTVRQWRDLAELYASAPGLYPTPEHVRAAVLGLVPGAAFGAGEHGDPGEPDPTHERVIPGLSAVGDAPPRTSPDLTNEGGDRASLSTALDPLLDRGTHAAERRDWDELADVLQGLHSLERIAEESVRSIIVRERRRVVPSSVLEDLVRQLPEAGPGSRIGQALSNLGVESAEAIFEVLADGPGRSERRTYLDVLAVLDGAESVLIENLTSRDPEILRDAADVVGRRRVIAAVLPLADLLRHSNEETRAAAWYALEAIGTPEAMTELNRKR